MQKLKHTKKPFWRNKKDVHDRALGLLMVAVGVLSLSFSLPAFGGNDFSNIAGVSALEVCRQEFDAPSSDGKCAPVATEDGTMIARVAVLGQCKSAPELNDEMRRLSREFKEINALALDMTETRAVVETISKGLDDTVDEASKSKLMQTLLVAKDVASAPLTAEIAAAQSLGQAGSAVMNVVRGSAVDYTAEEVVIPGPVQAVEGVQTASQEIVNQYNTLLSVVENKRNSILQQASRVNVGRNELLKF